MKRKFVLISCIGVFIAGMGSGCSDSKEAAKPTERNVAVVESKLPQATFEAKAPVYSSVDNFNKLLKSNPNEKDVRKFVKAEAASVSQEDASALVLGLEDYQNTKIKQSYYPENNEKAAPIISDDIAEKGYKIIEPEGMQEVVIDYESYKEFDDLVTDDIKEYIQIKLVESNKRTMEDGSLLITPDEVLDRGLKCEEFMQKYPKSKRYAEIKQMFLSYASNYIYGCNNTPAFDYESKSISPSFLESYKKAVTKTTDSRIVHVLKRYLQVLKENDFKKTPTVESFLKLADRFIENGVGVN